MKLKGLATPSVFVHGYGTISVVDTSPRPQIEEEEQEAKLSNGKDRRRPKKTGLQKDLDKMGMSWGEAKNRTKKPTRWRTTVDAVCPPGATRNKEKTNKRYLLH